MYRSYRIAIALLLLQFTYSSHSLEPLYWCDFDIDTSNNCQFQHTLAAPSVHPTIDRMWTICISKVHIYHLFRHLRICSNTKRRFIRSCIFTNDSPWVQQISLYWFRLLYYSKWWRRYTYHLLKHWPNN